MLKPLYIDSRNINILVLDFQGFHFSRYADDKSAMSSKYALNSGLKDKSADAKLFAICVLISSTVCFNVHKTFDEKTLENLNVFKELTRMI